MPFNSQKDDIWHQNAFMIYGDSASTNQFPRNQYTKINLIPHPYLILYEGIPITKTSTKGTCQALTNPRCCRRGPNTAKGCSSFKVIRSSPPEKYHTTMRRLWQKTTSHIIHEKMEPDGFPRVPTSWIFHIRKNSSQNPAFEKDFVSHFTSWIPPPWIHLFSRNLISSFWKIPGTRCLNRLDDTLKAVSNGVSKLSSSKTSRPFCDRSNHLRRWTKTKKQISVTGKVHYVLYVTLYRFVCKYMII